MIRQPIQHRALDLRAIIVTTLLALLTALAVCTIPTAHAEAAEVTEVWTSSDLANIKNDLSGSYILMADIVLDDENWMPIGSPSSFNDGSGTGFKGTFDGNRHTVKNVRVSSFSTNNGIQYAGFFGATNGATIKNLTLENVTIIGAYSGDAAHDLMVGSLVGLAVNTNISGCNVVGASVVDTFSGTRSDTNNYAIGGMIGDLYADGSNEVSIQNCSVADASVKAGASFTGNADSVQSFTGGLVGRLRERNSAKVSFSSSMFDGEVRGAGYVGPFIGGARIGDSPKAGKISKDAADRSVNSFYSGEILGLEGHPNESYNCGEGVWDEDWNYKKDEALVTDKNRAEALSKLGSDWRIAVLPSGSASLVVDHRNAYISTMSLDHGQAILTGTLSGYFNNSEKGSAVLSWSAGGVSGSGLTFSVPITSESQTVVLQLRDGGSVLSTTTSEVEAGSIELYLTKTRDDKTGDVTTITAEVVGSYGGFTADDLDFMWYGIAGEAATELQKGGTSLVKSKFGDYEEFKVTVESKQSSSIAAKATVNIIGRTVYLKSDGYDSENKGFSPDAPVRTFARAYELLDKNGTRETNVIVVMDQYTDTEFGYDDTTFNKPATITSFDADLNVDYRTERDALLGFYNTSGEKHVGDDSTRIKGKLLFADTTFKDITLSAVGGGDSKWRIGYIYCQGYSLTMDTGVRMEGYRRTSDAVNSYGLLAGTNSNDFNIVGGFANYDEDPGTGYPQDRGICEIVIKSGSYGRVIAGGRNYDSPENGKTGVNRTSHNQFATEGEPFRVSVMVDIASNQSQMGSGSNNCDIGQLTGGQTDGTIYCDSTITLKNGVVPQLFGSSIGYNRSVNFGGTTYPSNDFVGAVQVNFEGGSVAQLYGGCLGRTASGAKENVDARFRSFSQEQRDEPDIAINISGDAVIGPISGITAPLTGVFAAGAGGITGEGNPDTGEVANKVDVLVNISGGTITGKLYGGGYGQSSAVTIAALACLEAGNLYGSSTVNITGGTINADVYGGGAGTGTYLGGNPSTNALAQIVGDVKLSISGAEINGSVYGGSQGVVQSGSDCSSMAKITGKVELSIENARIAGNVYGGSALGAITGGATTALNNTSVNGSVYGGGEGELVSFYNLEQQRTVGLVGGNAELAVEGGIIGGNVFGGGSVGAVLGERGVATTLRGVEVKGSVFGGGEGSLIEGNSDTSLQKLIGWVKGDASIVLNDNTNVAGDVFGGGSLGVVGDGALSSEVVPYSITSPSNVTVRIENARVGKSVFGGGAGEASAGSLMPRLLGAVFGTSSVTVHEGTVGEDVFGGGDQSYSYAPLDDNGAPGKAATVVVNGGDALYVNDDGSIANGPADGVREVDVPAGDASAPRAISLGGSVFGGGNISEAHTVSANNYTMYGDTEVFVKGQGVDFAGSDRGGVYGDGNLSRAYGERTVTLVELHTPQENGTLAAKRFFSLQRANRAVVHDCSIYLHGAKDLVNESDQTLYSLNRVDNLNLYANSTVQFDTVVNGLGNLYSDVLPERMFTSGGTTDFGDNVTDAEKGSYRKFASGQAEFWKDATGKEHRSINTIIVNNGKWLDVKQPADAADASYGAVTGLFSLISSNAQQGGAFVFGQFTPQDSTGTFISLNREGEEANAEYLELYTKQTTDVDGKACRVWFIKGAAYTYERDLRAYTTSDSASIRVLLPVEWADEGMNLALDSGHPITITDASDMVKDADGEGKYEAGMVVGSSDPLPFHSGENKQWVYNYTNDVKKGDGPALLPATITINIKDLSIEDELEPQNGKVEFTLLASNGTQYRFIINIKIERVYAVAYETVYPGRVYENIGLENTTPITPTSSYTAQFTTTYSPGAYRSTVEASLNASTKADIHGESHDGQFPAGTKITMVNITDPMGPAYYYYECNDEIRTIPLADFKSMSTGENYANPTGNTVIVEDLLFVVDYSAANNGTGKAAGVTYLALNHLYGAGDAKKDILRYDRKGNEGEEPEHHYNNLWNSYTISQVTDGTYMSSKLESPINAASLVVGHTSNFMYDTYTTKLSLTPASNCVSTLFDENHVMLQMSLQGDSNDASANPNTMFPLGTRLVVKRTDGTEVASRYFHEENGAADASGYFMVDLGDRRDSEYVVELQVARYVEGGALGLAFGKHTDGFKLKIGLFVSPDGLYRSADRESFANFEVSFQAVRSCDDPAPEYELGENYKKGDYLQVENGQVKGSSEEGSIVLGKGNLNDNVDAEMVVLRRPAGSPYAAVDITTLGGSVTRDMQGKNIKFFVTDTPSAGTYEYEIRIGNTVYFQTVAVP